MAMLLIRIETGYTKVFLSEVPNQNVFSYFKILRSAIQIFVSFQLYKSRRLTGITYDLTCLDPYG
jgi:hypothetical protein